MGKVYKVRNSISNRVEAMKVILPDLAQQTQAERRFMREIKLQARLKHPNIAGLYNGLRVGNQLLMLMEFVEGVTLEQKLKDGPLPTAVAVNYISQVLSALDYAHARGVIHRDVKPANMMLTPDGDVKLMDFSLAKPSIGRNLTLTKYSHSELPDLMEVVRRCSRKFSSNPGRERGHQTGRFSASILGVDRGTAGGLSAFLVATT